MPLRAHTRTHTHTYTHTNTHPPPLYVIDSRERRKMREFGESSRGVMNARCYLILDDIPTLEWLLIILPHCAELGHSSTPDSLHLLLGTVSQRANLIDRFNSLRHIFHRNILYIIYTSTEKLLCASLMFILDVWKLIGEKFGLNDIQKLYCTFLENTKIYVTVSM